MVVKLDENAVGVVDEDAADAAVRRGERFQGRGQLDALGNQFVGQRLDVGTVKEMWLIPTWSSLIGPPSGSSPGWQVSTSDGAVLPGP